jgi:uroporphyrin-III C-methyltransferase
VAFPVLGAPAVPAASWSVAAQVIAALLATVCVVSLSLVWTTHQRVKALEQELVRRQQSSQDQATEARLMARQAQDAATEVVAKQSLLEARVAESALQRSQVEELIQSLSRSRDENVLSDVEAALRVAQQQSAITGSPDPLVTALKQADERLARYNQPRLDRVRRAVAKDLDRARAVGAADVPALSIRLDEAVRLIDELPLLSTPDRRSNREPVKPVAMAASHPAAAAQAGGPDAWSQGVALVQRWWDLASRNVWQETRSLLRITRIEHPEAMLIAPDQAYFLRENLKLRLLNARLALLSRQFEQAQTDLQQAQAALERYFDRSSRRVVTTVELVKQVAAQSRHVLVPRPDETLAALAAAAAGR